MPDLLKNLNFWGTLLNLLGLFVLLARDVSYLEPFLRKLPPIRHVDKLLRELKSQCMSLGLSLPQIYAPHSLQALTGTEARDLLELFPDWSPSQTPPKTVLPVALVGTKARLAEFLQDPFIAPQSPNEDGYLCEPIPLSLLFTQAESLIRRELYKWGFLLMFLGTLLLLAGTLK